MVGSGRDEDGLALGEPLSLVLDLERALSVEDDVDLVEGVRRLPVGLGRDEDVDADLETQRRVDDLVATALPREPCSAGAHGEVLHALDRTSLPPLQPSSGALETELDC